MSLGDQNVKGFYAIRVVEADIEADAIERALDRVRVEMRSQGQSLGDLKVETIRRMNPDEAPPKKLETHFWNSEYDPEPFFQRLASFLHAHGIAFEVDESLIRVPKSNPTEIDICVRYDDGFMIESDLWHGHFDDDDVQANACFQWLLSPFFRTVQEKVGEEWVGSWLERYQENGWHAMQPVLGVNVLDLISGPGPFELTTVQLYWLNPGDYTKVVRGAKLDERGLPPGSSRGLQSVTLHKSRLDFLGLADGLKGIDLSRAERRVQ